VKRPAKPRRRRLSPGEAARVAEIFRRFEAASPDPRTELAYASPYMLLVAVVLSAQATDKSVNKATEKLYAVAATPRQMLALGEAGLTPFIA
jgi:endonuclease III